MELKEIIHQSLERSMSGEEYQQLLYQYAEEGKASGNATEDLINFTKLNAQRSKRMSKTVKLDEGLLQAIAAMKSPVQWLLITETWCGDAANSAPVITKVAESSPNINLRVVFRDENEALIDEFLTNGGRAIPKMVALDEDKNVLYTWGAKPAELQNMFNEWKHSDDPNKPPYKEFQVEIQKWYNQNKGVALQSELLALISEEAVTV